MRSANREFGLNKKKKTVKISSLPTADELRAAYAASTATKARAALVSLFDEGTFVETGAYTKRAYNDYVTEGKSDEFEGVITGYGAVNGTLVFAFAQDAERMKGAVDAAHAEKICRLYQLALSKSAPVVGIFDSCGADVFEGIGSLAAYGRLLRTVTTAAESIPQYAYIIGNCTGMMAGIASAFDFVIKSDDAVMYVTSPALGGKEVAGDKVHFSADKDTCAAYLRSLISYLDADDDPSSCTDDLNRRLGNITFAGNGRSAVATIADNGTFIEVYEKYGAGVVTAFATIGGIRCGIIASDYQTDNGRITEDNAKKMTDFITLCDAFGLCVVHLVDTDGVCACVTPETVMNLSVAYAQLSVPTVSVVIGHAIGAGYVLMGSKSLGCDIAYALENAEIGVLTAPTGVAFAWNDEVTTETTREELEAAWRESVSSPVAAASKGDIDDIISMTELRARIASALLMLSR